MSAAIGIIIVIVCLVIAVFGFATLSNNKDTKNTMGAKFRFPGFMPDLEVIKIGMATSLPRGVAVDQKARKLAIITGDAVTEVDFDAVTSIEMITTSKTKTHSSGGLTRAVVGGLIAGPAGAVVGAVTSSKVSVQDLTGVSLAIGINGLLQPYTIDFIELTMTGSTFPEAAYIEANGLRDRISAMIDNSRMQALGMSRIETPLIEQ